ncbi:MAG: hypothetical protein AAFO04_13115 [Cyanobacteria bacterium J06592_8]
MLIFCRDLAITTCDRTTICSEQGCPHFQTQGDKIPADKNCITSASLQIEKSEQQCNSTTFNIDGNQAFEDLLNLLDPSLGPAFSGVNRPVSGTLIREASTGTMIAVVEGVTPEQIEASFITV